MDYEKLIEALTTIKEICAKVSDCARCPLGSKKDACLLHSSCPTDWIITKPETIVRVMK